MQITKQRQRIADFFGLKKSIVALLTMVILVGLGEKMAERFLPLYLMALGGGAFSVGLLNGLDNLLSALYSFPGGYASDKLGYKRALLLYGFTLLNVPCEICWYRIFWCAFVSKFPMFLSLSGASASTKLRHYSLAC